VTVRLSHVVSQSNLFLPEVWSRSSLEPLITTAHHLYIAAVVYSDSFGKKTMSHDRRSVVITAFHTTRDCLIDNLVWAGKAVWTADFEAEQD